MKKFFMLLLVLSFITRSACAVTYGIEVDTSQCNISLYEKTDFGWVKLDTRKCCVGAKNKTPTGIAAIQRKKAYFIRDGKRYNYVAYFSSDCAFHSTAYIDGEYDNSSLGHHRSNGCIRLSPKVARWIYRHCKVGTMVYIH